MASIIKKVDWLTWVLIALLLGLLGGKFILENFSTHAGEKAPAIRTELISGEKFNLKELRGNYVIVNFWASWCYPCRKENAYLVQLYDQYSSKEYIDAEGMEVVTIALEKSKYYWKKAAESAGFNWKYQIVENARVVFLSNLARRYGVTEIPSKFLIGPAGDIILAKSNYREIVNYLEGQIK